MYRYVRYINLSILPSVFNSKIDSFEFLPGAIKTKELKTGLYNKNNNELYIVFNEKSQVKL